MRMPRFTIRRLMVVVLVVGLICGAFAQWYARQLRRQGLIAQLHVQQQVTDSVIHPAIANLSTTGPKPLTISSGDSFGHEMWTAQVDAYAVLGGRRVTEILVEI